MSAVGFETNANQLAARLGRLAQRLGDPEPTLRRAQLLLERSEAQTFQTQGASLGEHWAAAAEPERKRESRMLVASGRLRDSLQGGSALKVRGSQLIFGTDVPYGHFHQYGTSNMPARVFLGIPPNLARALIELFERAIGESE